MQGDIAMTQENSLKQVSRIIRRKKVVTLEALASSLQCSKRTVQRRLAKLKTLRSYNRNGSYYTLADVAEFDTDGLWCYHGTCFSQFGNLPRTFVQLVHNSPAGLTFHETGELIGLEPGSFIWSFHNHPEIKRQKYQGRYVYFASEPTRYAQQYQNRIVLHRSKKLPSDLQAIAILVAKIKEPKLSFDELSDKLKGEKLCIAPEVIENLFVHHGLVVKKNHI